MGGFHSHGFVSLLDSHGQSTDCKAGVGIGRLAEAMIMDGVKDFYEWAAQ